MKSSRYLLFLALVACVVATSEVNAQAKQAIQFEVRVPSDAVLEIGDRTMKETGDIRSFKTPPVELDKSFNYTLKATKDGKTVTRVFRISHDGDNTIDLRPDFVGTSVAKPKATTGTASAQNNVPHPDPEFKGKIGATYKDSQMDTDLFKSPTAPKEAPNILLVLIDDAGFGATDTRLRVWRSAW